MSNVAEQFLQLLIDRGHHSYTGVPCSLLKGAFRYLEGEMEQERPRIRYVSAVREDSALGLAVGMYLGGEKPVVLMQNSGLGYCLNVLTSLHLVYSIPMLLIISWRGAEGMNDAVEHEVMGKNMPDVLSAVGIPYVLLETDKIEASVDACLARLEAEQKPVALLIREAL